MKYLISGIITMFFLLIVVVQTYLGMFMYMGNGLPLIGDEGIFLNLSVFLGMMGLIIIWKDVKWGAIYTLITLVFSIYGQIVMLTFSLIFYWLRFKKTAQHKKNWISPKNNNLKFWIHPKH